MAQVALIGHAKPKTQRTRARISSALSDHAVANSWYDPSNLPSWLNEECYVQQIQPRLRMIKVREISDAMQVSKAYAGLIRSGRNRPHPRHWQVLAEVKMHTLLDLHGNIPSFIRITDGKTADVNILDEFLPEAGAFYVMDRGYIDFARLFVFPLCSAFFVVRTKENVLLQRRYSHPVDKSTGVRSDHTVILTTIESAKAYPDPLRRVSYLDVENQRRL